MSDETPEPADRSGESEPKTIAGFDAVDPGSVGDSGSGSGARKRGRPRGSKNGDGKGAAKTRNLKPLEGVLLTVHFAAAKLLELPELQLANEEAEALAVAVQTVNDQYSTTLSPKIMAWMQLGMVAGSIYGTRIYAIRARRVAGGPAKNVLGFPKKESMSSEQSNRPGAPGGDNLGGGDAARTPADLFGLNYSASIAAEL